MVCAQPHARNTRLAQSIAAFRRTHAKSPGMRWNRSARKATMALAKNGRASGLNTHHILLIGLLILGRIGSVRGQEASLSVSSLEIVPGDHDVVVVSGDLNNLSTFGVTILIELVPRPESVGVVAFSTAPPVDVHQLGDPWPMAGTFSAFDTNTIPFSSSLNAAVDDDGRFLCDTPVTYSGPLVGFPIVSSGNASGVWDVHLSTRFGNSIWECDTPVTTTLTSGTITVFTDVPTTSTWALLVFALLLVSTASLMIRSSRSPPTACAQELGP